MRDWIARAASKLSAIESGADEGEEAPMDTSWRKEELHDWAQAVPWDTSNPDDVWPLHLPRPSGGGLRAAATSDVSPTFMRAWGERLQWPDRDMLAQAAHGVLSRAQLNGDSVFMFMHKGLQRNMAPAVELVKKEQQHRRVTVGSALPQTIPARLVPYNCVSQHKWRLRDGVLSEVEKWRVTTDDTIAADGCDARNPSIDREAWPDANLCKPQHLGEATAILQTVRPPPEPAVAGRLPCTLTEAVAQTHAAAAAHGASLSPAAAERVALWALDLSDAYRALGVHWSELPHQGFIWTDGARTNLRCLFGTAQMVGFFQRVSLFVLATAQELMAEYDAAVPVSRATAEWLRARKERVAGYQMVYIDDALAASILAPGERLVGAHRTSATLAGVESRAQAHQRLTRQQYVRAGWRVALPKLQLGFAIGALGVGVDSGDGPGDDGAGQLFCPEEKRQGLLAETERLLPRAGESAKKAATRTTVRSDVERITGRLSHLAQVEPAGRVHLAAMYTMQTAMRPTSRGRELPRRLHLSGQSPSQVAWQEAIAWWRAALQQGLSVPLAPKAVFPSLEEPGALAVFSDAASEPGTGIGAYAPVLLHGDSKPTLLYLEERWPQWAQRALEAGTLSMPAGEMAGTCAIALAAMRRLGDVASVHVFTDCEPSQLAINTDASGSPQLNFLLRWLQQQLGATQALAWHQPGKRNWAADGLSRDGNGGATVAEVLAAARDAGLRTEKITLDAALWDVLKEAQGVPQRAQRKRPRPVQGEAA